MTSSPLSLAAFESRIHQVHGLSRQRRRRRQRRDANAERTLPHNLEAERSVLGAILRHNDAFSPAAAVIDADDFFRDAHRRIFRKMATLLARGVAIDLVTLKEELGRAGELDEVGGPAYITALVDGMPRSTNVPHYARILKEKSTLRRLIFSVNKILATAYESGNDVDIILGSAARDIGRLAQDEVANKIDLSQDAVDFLALAPDPRPPLVKDLIPGVGISLPHGQPRARKSLVVLETFLSAALCRAPFGLARLEVVEPIVSWYLTEEDNAGEVKKRVRALLAGHDIAAPPAGFRLSAQKGFSLDDVGAQDCLIREILKYGVQLLALDPLRAVTSAVDKGPGDLQPLVKSLRRIMRETNVVLVLAHHDTKLKSDGKADDRPRAQRASGGGILSISEAPLHLERVSDDVSLLVPNLWKFSSDPPPIKVRFESRPGWLRLAGEDVEASAAEALALHERILAALTDHGYTATSRLATTVRARKEDVMQALEQLKEAGKVDAVKAGNANKWFIREGAL